MIIESIPMYTCMTADPEPEVGSRHVRDLYDLDPVQEIQGQGGYLRGMTHPVPVG